MNCLILLNSILLLVAATPVGTPLPSAAGGTAGPNPNRLLAVVGGDSLTMADLDVEILSTLAAAKGRGTLPPLDPDGVLKRLTQNLLLEQEGYRIGADQQPAVQNQVRETIRLRAVKALMDSVSSPQPGAAALPPDTLPGLTRSMRRYAHILVKDEASARALRDSLSRGVPFADLARRHSSDRTAAAGGDLGWAAQGAYVDQFEAAAGSLAPHQIAGPVKTQFGWHLITLVEARTDTLKNEEMAKSLTESRERTRRTKAVGDYVETLKKKYGVTVDDSLLSRLDYGSQDPQVQKELQSSEAILATLPAGKLTVRSLTRDIKFQYFHGLAGHPDAGAIRDRMFKELLIESLLSHEAHLLGFDRRPEILREARREERRLTREEVLKSIFGFEFKPGDQEIRAYYDAHQKEFTPEPRVKVQSALFPDQEAAGRFRKQLDAGSGFKWLLTQTAAAAESLPPYPTDWVAGDQIGLGRQPAAVGQVIGPQPLQNGWAVAEITALEVVGPTPFDQCRDQVSRALHDQRSRQAINDAIARLESATKITIASGAREAVADRVEQLRSAMKEGGRP